MYIFHTFIDQNKINSKVIPIKNATQNDFSFIHFKNKANVITNNLKSFEVKRVLKKILW